MEKGKIQFIELPKNEVVLSQEEQAYLLGRGDCRAFSSCEKNHADLCTDYVSGNCSGAGPCGGQLYCSAHACSDYNY